MNYISHDIEKSNGVVPFRTRDGRLVVPVRCGGWRRVRPLDLALLPAVSRQIVLLRDMEG